MSVLKCSESGKNCSTIDGEGCKDSPNDPIQAYGNSNIIFIEKSPYIKVGYLKKR